MNWDYCECGCHGHEAIAGQIRFWIFNDLLGNFYLHRGHGRLSPLIEMFTSWQDACNKANQIVQEEIDKMKTAIKI